MTQKTTARPVITYGLMVCGDTVKTNLEMIQNIWKHREALVFEKGYFSIQNNYEKLNISTALFIWIQLDN